MKKIFSMLLCGAMLISFNACESNDPEQENVFNGHDYVDLDLPSGILWATCNVGANSPEEYGDYFAWGETKTKKDYSIYTYKYATGYDMTKYCTDESYGRVDYKTTLDASDDAATANWGGQWRMPTYAEQQELLDNCTWAWIRQDGVNGYRVIGRNGNSIFLPAAGCRYETNREDAGVYGYYWSSLVDAGDPDDALCISFSSERFSWDDNSRDVGLSVRPVCSPQ